MVIKCAVSMGLHVDRSAAGLFSCVECVVVMEHVVLISASVQYREDGAVPDRRGAYSNTRPQEPSKPSTDLHACTIR